MGKAGKLVLVGLLAFGLFGVWPFIYFRIVYDHGKRFREVEPGRVYRSGQMTAEGFTDMVERYGIRVIVNVQDDVPDPDLQMSFWNRATIKESELCRRLGVRYIHLAPDLVAPQDSPEQHPHVIDEFLAVMDEADNYPVLIHCRAGLHRTGVLSAVYRMEYQGWSPAAAFRELRAHGFGEAACTAANEYVWQYVLTWKPRSARVANMRAHVAE
jgi:protein tyrosine/serine phosphatase